MGISPGFRPCLGSYGEFQHLGWLCGSTGKLVFIDETQCWKANSSMSLWFRSMCLIYSNLVYLYQLQICSLLRCMMIPNWCIDTLKGSVSLFLMTSVHHSFHAGPSRWRNTWIMLGKNFEMAARPGISGIPRGFFFTCDNRNRWVSGVKFFLETIGVFY